MIRAATLLALALIAGPAAAQVVSAPPSSIDTSTLMPRSEAQASIQALEQQIATAKQAGDNAATAAAAAQAAIPIPASTVPNMEMVGGAVGTANTFRRGDAVQPRISRTVSGVTVANGTAAVTWPAMPSVPKLTVTPYVASTAVNAPMCFPVAGSVTTVGATVKCYTTQTVTVSILGAVVAPITTAAAGVNFDVLALPGS